MIIKTDKKSRINQTLVLPIAGSVFVNELGEVEVSQEAGEFLLRHGWIEIPTKPKNDNKEAEPPKIEIEKSNLDFSSLTIREMKEVAEKAGLLKAEFKNIMSKAKMLEYINSKLK